MRPPPFRVVLPPVQFCLASLMGGYGIWQRSKVLGQPFAFGQTLMDSTARFHVWPWPFKIAAVINMPALLGGSLLSFAYAALHGTRVDVVDCISSLFLITPFWYWMGCILDSKARQSSYRFLILFALASAACASFPIGYTSYLPLGLITWIMAGVSLQRMKASGARASARLF